MYSGQRLLTLALQIDQRTESQTQTDIQTDICKMIYALSYPKNDISYHFGIYHSAKQFWLFLWCKTFLINVFNVRYFLVSIIVEYVLSVSLNDNFCSLSVLLSLINRNRKSLMLFISWSVICYHYAVFYH